MIPSGQVAAVTGARSGLRLPVFFPRIMARDIPMMQILRGELPFFAREITRIANLISAPGPSYRLVDIAAT